MWSLNRTIPVLLAMTTVWLISAAPLQAESARDLASGYVQQALEVYPSLQADRQDVAIAKAKRKEAFGAMLPDVSAGSRYTRSTGGREIRFDINDLLPASVIPVDVPPTIIPFMRETEQETKLNVVQPIFTGGGLVHSWKASKKAEEASIASFKGKENELAYTVEMACYNAFAAKELVRMRSDELQQAREQLRTVQQKYATQMTPLGEVKRAEAAVASAEADSISANASAQVALANLNRFVGQPHDTPLPELENDDSLPPLLVTLDEAKEVARDKRPELHSLNAAVGSVRESVRASKSSYMPNLIFAGEYGYQGEEYSFTGDDDYGTASLVLNWSLFEGGQRSARVQQARLAQRQLEFRQQEAEETVMLDVTNAWLQAQSRLSSWTAATRGVAAASEGYRMTEELFREGMVSQLQMLDARSTLTDARTSEITSRYSYLTSLADLERSMGVTPGGNGQ